jgi:GH24 family phage-related lysozyme (muramidase)
MTRIAAGTTAQNQSTIDGPLAQAAGAAPEAGATAGASSPGQRGLSGHVGPDRPAPQSGAGGRQAPIDVRAFMADLRRWEGEHRFMYVDTRGYVTTGIGHLLKKAEAALDLPWQHKATGQRATPAEVRAVFERMCEKWADYKRENPNGKGIPAPKFEPVSDLVLPDGFATKLAIDRLQGEFLPKLKALFPGFDSCPVPAQRALVDMAYNLGVDGLKKKFPSFVAAWRDGDFALAAKESERSSSRAERNDATRNLLLEAAQLNASVRTLAREVRL